MQIMGATSRTSNSERGLSYITWHINSRRMILAELLSALGGPVPDNDAEAGTPRVPSNKSFGEHNQLGAKGRRLSQQLLRLVEGGGSVVEDGGGLDHGSAHGGGGRRVGHHIDLRDQWAYAATVADRLGSNQRHCWDEVRIKNLFF